MGNKRGWGLKSLMGTGTGRALPANSPPRVHPYSQRQSMFNIKKNGSRNHRVHIDQGKDLYVIYHQGSRNGQIDAMQSRVRRVPNSDGTMTFVLGIIELGSSEHGESNLGLVLSPRQGRGGLLCPR
uniref:Uncharacterized protein n=1 Tax=Cannabis sativa TaxID=3483 RepID=A0A803PTD9_CANSA